MRSDRLMLTSLLAAIPSLMSPFHVLAGDTDGTTTNVASPPTSAPIAPAPPSATPANARAALRYASLMKLPIDERLELIDKAPAAERDQFLSSLPGDRKAALAVDPNDCGTWARAKRLTLATGEADEGVISNTTQDIAQSAVVALANSMFSNLGSALSGAAKVKELSKLGEYKDICDISKEERLALLSPKESDAEQAEPKRPEASLLDRASRFFAR